MAALPSYDRGMTNKRASLLVPPDLFKRLEARALLHDSTPKEQALEILCCALEKLPTPAVGLRLGRPVFLHLLVPAEPYAKLDALCRVNDRDPLQQAVSILRAALTTAPPEPPVEAPQ